MAFHSPIDGQHPLVRLLASLYMNQHQDSPHFLGPPVRVPPGGGGDGGPAFIGPPLHLPPPGVFAGKDVDPSFNQRMQMHAGAFNPPGVPGPPDYAAALGQIIGQLQPQNAVGGPGAPLHNPRPNLPEY